MKYYYADDVIQKMKKAKQLIVFGAGNVAYMVVSCLRNKPYQFPIEYCMVSEAEENPDRVSGVPVIDYSAAERLVYKEALILVATVEKYLDSVQKGLQHYGFFNIWPITYENDLWSLLRGNCYRDYQLSQHRPYRTVEEELLHVSEDERIPEKTISVYRACCDVDKKLSEDITRFSWEIPIQAGAELTAQKVCPIRDNTGKNISYKNRQYCELTVLYWMWKNDKSDYVGLVHYRRHFELDIEQLRRLKYSDIDIVLTIPIMDIPDVETVYRRDHIGDDWDVMLEAIRSIFPEYMETAMEMQKGNFYYAYNMFIMRRKILENYCEWLFPLLSYCEEHCKVKEDTYQNRYIGFLAEHLFSIYFMHHEREYKIVHARKHFVVS